MSARASLCRCPIAYRKGCYAGWIRRNAERAATPISRTVCVVSWSIWARESCLPSGKRLTTCRYLVAKHRGSAKIPPVVKRRRYAPT